MCFYRPSRYGNAGLWPEMSRLYHFNLGGICVETSGGALWGHQEPNVPCVFSNNLKIMNRWGFFSPLLCWCKASKKLSDELVRFLPLQLTVNLPFWTSRVKTKEHFWRVIIFAELSHAKLKGFVKTAWLEFLRLYFSSHHFKSYFNINVSIFYVK